MKIDKKEKEIILFSLDELRKKIAVEKFDLFYELKFSEKEEVDEYTQYDKIEEIIKKIEKIL